MRCVVTVSVVSLVAWLGSNWVHAEDLTVMDVPPVVVRTAPESGSKDVDPALKEIKVTFSKNMQDGSWSWTGGGETYPKTAGKPRYEKDQRTCILPVELQPGKVYMIGVNSPSFKNFKDADGRPAMPYLIVFQTKAK